MERRTGLLHNQSGDRRDGVLGSSGITISIADHAGGGAVGGGGGGGGGDGGEGNSAGLLPRRGLDFGPGSGGSSGGQYMRPGLGGSEDMLQWSVLTDGSLDSELDGNCEDVLLLTLLPVTVRAEPAVEGGEFGPFFFFFGASFRIWDCSRPS